MSGGNTADIRVQWGASDELPLFNRSLCAVSRFDGTAWVTGSFASATGADPFSSTVTAVNAFREFSVMDNLLNLNTSVEGSGARDSTVPQLFPQPADQVLHMKAADGQDHDQRAFAGCQRPRGPAALEFQHRPRDA